MMALPLGDSYRDQIKKLEIRVRDIMAKAPSYHLLNERLRKRVDEYRIDIANLRRTIGEKDLTYLEQLRKEVDEFCLVEDMRGWDKPEEKKSKLPYEAGFYMIHHRLHGKIMSISA